MCGIFGYIGEPKAASIILEGIKNLQYRGYDSAGIVVFNGKVAQCVKKKGKVAKIEKILAKNPLDGFIGIGHTRWATHGEPSDKNAHPFCDCKGEIWLVHNGIIENYLELKNSLIRKGHKFSSETDTEVVVHLLEDFYRGDIKQAVGNVMALLKGAYAFVLFTTREPDKIIVARTSSPLIVASNKKETFVSSGPTALYLFAKKAIALKDGQIGVLKKGKIEIFQLDGQKSSSNLEQFEISQSKASKGKFEHFMLKEINEIPQAIKNSIRGRLILNKNKVKLGGLESVAQKLAKINELKIIGCGSAYYASLYGKYIIEYLTKIPCEADVGSEFRYRTTPFLNKKRAAVLFISQSGETADSLASLRKVNKEGILSLGLVNVVSSSIARETKAGIYNHIGPEIAVVTTKAIVSQMVILNLIALYLAQIKKIKVSEKNEIIESILTLPNKAYSLLKLAPHIEKIAKKYLKYNGFTVFGRGFNYPAALEGALKLKETAYINASGYTGGEFKHGAIALIDKNFPSIAIIPKDFLYEKMFSNAQEIKARKGPLIALASEQDAKIAQIADDIIYVPQTHALHYPILNIMALQLFAYYLAKFKGLNIDQPRNLAKSVTVE